MKYSVPEIQLASTTDQTTNNGALNHLTGLSAKGKSFLICNVGASDKKGPTKHELSHNVKVRKNNLACEIPIPYATVITGYSRDRRLLRVGPSTGHTKQSEVVDEEH